MNSLGADDEVHCGLFLQQSFAAALRHATYEPEHQIGVVAFQLGQHAHFADRLLLGEIANAAGVQQNHVGIALGRSDGIPARCSIAATASLSRSFIWQP